MQLVEKSEAHLLYELATQPIVTNNYFTTGRRFNRSWKENEAATDIAGEIFRDLYSATNQRREFNFTVTFTSIITKIYNVFLVVTKTICRCYIVNFWNIDGWNVALVNK